MREGTGVTEQRLSDYLVGLRSCLGIVHTQYMSGVLVFWHCMGGGLEGGQDRIMMSYDMVSFGSVRPANLGFWCCSSVRSASSCSL